MTTSTTIPTQEPLRIVELIVENVKRVAAVHLTPSGESIVIGGNNAQGKTSVLDAIEMALAGKKCERPVRDGETKGRVVADLGELVVTRTFTPGGGGTLTVANANGARFSSPQTMLDALLGRIAFDPLAFTRMKPKEQLETLREITGVSTALIDASRAKKFDERTAANRKVKEIEAQVAGMMHHPDAPAEEASVEDLKKQLDAATLNNSKRAEFIRQGKADADRVSALAKDAERIRAEIARLTAQLEDIEKNISSSNKILDEMRKRAAEWQEQDTDALVMQIGEISVINRKVFENRLRADAVEALEKWKTTANALTAEIEALDVKKREKLEGAKYPVQGLLLGEQGIMFNGVPFEQASAAEQLRVSVAIGIAANPRLRVMLVRDGALLDATSLAEMQNMAERAGAQLFIERVGKGGECSVIIEDGRIQEGGAE